MTLRLHEKTHRRSCTSTKRRFDGDWQKSTLRSELLNDTALELHGEDASAVRLPWKLAHEALPSCRSRIAPSVSSSIGERIKGGSRRAFAISLSLASTSQLNVNHIGTSRSWFRPSWSPC